MAKIRVQRTKSGDVKIVLDPTSALKLARIINWSEAIGGDCAWASHECNEGEVEELSWALHEALAKAGVRHEDL